MKLLGFNIQNDPLRGLSISRPSAAVRRARKIQRRAMAGEALKQSEVMALGAFGGFPWTPSTGISTHPVLNLWYQTHGWGETHRTQLELFHVLSMMIPVIGSAIEKRRQLEGCFYAESKDKGLNTALQEFVDYVPVGPIEGGSAKGLNVYLDSLCDASDRYGMGVGEPVFDEGMRNMEYLLTADSRSLSVREVPGTIPRQYQLIQLQDGIERDLNVDVDGAMVDRIAFEYVGTNPWPVPMIFGLESLAEVVVRMISATNNLWMRVGDPSYLRQIVYDKEARITNKISTKGVDGRSVEVDANLYNLQQGLQQIDQAKNLGMAGDLSMSVIGGEVKQDPLFEHPATASVAPYLHEHYPVISGEIIDASGVPHFLFFNGQQKAEGLGSNRAQTQAALAIAAAKQRQTVKGRIGRRIVDAYLLSIGAGSFLSRYEWYFDETSVLDQKLMVEADKTEAEAASKWIEVAMELFRPDTADDGNAVWTPAAVEFLREHGVINEMTRLN